MGNRTRRSRRAAAASGAPGAVAASLAAGEVCLEELQSVGQVCPPEAYAGVIWLVVDRTLEEQDAGFGQSRAVPGEVIDACDAGETDRACRWAYQLEGFGVPFKEDIEEGRSSIKLAYPDSPP